MKLSEIKAKACCEEAHFSDYQVDTKAAMEFEYMKQWLIKKNNDEFAAKAAKSEAFVRVRHDNGNIYELMLFMGDDMPTVHTNEPELVEQLIDMIEGYGEETI